jgi:mediator of RNA polymerase II transcription subunit 14
MPGILIMDDSGAIGALGAREGENKKRSHDGKLVNGDPPRREAASANAQSGASAVNGASLSVSALSTPTVDQLAQLPPEIRHIASEFYHPLGKMLVRIAQECYNQLSSVVTSMAEMPSDVYSNGNMSNGMGGLANGNLATSEANKQKKLKLLKFAQEQRGKFIKLLVLTDWGRRSSVDVCKLVDLFQWTKDQQYSIDSVDFQMLNIKMESNRLRQANPDIRTALEVLSTGKAAWIPDVCFHT